MLFGCVMSTIIIMALIMKIGIFLDKGNFAKTKWGYGIFTESIMIL